MFRGRRGGGVTRRADRRLRDALGEEEQLVAAGSAGLRELRGAVVGAGGKAICTESWRRSARGGLRVGKACTKEMINREAFGSTEQTQRDNHQHIYFTCQFTNGCSAVQLRATLMSFRAAFENLQLKSTKQTQGKAGTGRLQPHHGFQHVSDSMLVTDEAGRRGGRAWGASGTCGGGQRSPRCWPLLALGSPRAGRSGRAPSTTGGVVGPCPFHRLCDAVPGVTGGNCRWDGRANTSFCCCCCVVVFLPFVVLLVKRVGRGRGCAGSEVVPFETGQGA